MDTVQFDPSIFNKIFGDSAIVGILFFIVRSLWASKQEGDKALIDYLQKSKQEDLAAQAKQIESNDRLTEVISDLKDSIEKRNTDDDHRNLETERRLTAVENKVFYSAPRSRAKIPSATG